MNPIVLWLIAITAFILLVAVVAVEETRVHEAHREADSWRKRTCHHGSTSYAPVDVNGDEGVR